MKYWEIIADSLNKAGWSLGWVSALDLEGRTIWVVDTHGYGKRFIVRGDEKFLKRVQKSFELLLLLIIQFLIAPGQIYVARLRSHLMLADRFVERERGAVM